MELNNHFGRALAAIEIGQSAGRQSSGPTWPSAVGPGSTAACQCVRPRSVEADTPAQASSPAISPAGASTGPSRGADSLAFGEGQWAHTASLPVPSADQNDCKCVRRHLSEPHGLQTPWVKDRTKAGTAFAVADPMAAAIVDSSSGTATVVVVPVSQFAENGADGTATPRRSNCDRNSRRPRDRRLFTVPIGVCSRRAASSCDSPSRRHSTIASRNLPGRRPHPSCSKGRKSNRKVPS